MVLGGVILLIVTLLIILAVTVLRADSPKEVAHSAPFFQIVLWIVVFTSLQAAMVFMGHLTNKTRESHRFIIAVTLVVKLTSLLIGRYLISQHILHTQSKLANITLTRQNRLRDELAAGVNQFTDSPSLGTNCEEEIERMILQDTLSAATITLHAVEAMDTAEPESVMGIKAEGRTAIVIMYSLLIFIVAVLQYIAYGSVSSSGI
jgi:hypothetical protein